MSHGSPIQHTLARTPPERAVGHTATQARGARRDTENNFVGEGLRPAPAVMILVLIICGLLLAACSPTDPNEQFVQGKWTAAGDLGEGHSWYLEWTFNNGAFELVGYPPLAQTGKYHLVESKDNTLTLELTDQKGDLSTEDRTIVIVIDSTNNSLTIDNQGPFARSE